MSKFQMVVQPDAFADQYAPDEAVSAEFHSLQSVYDFTYEFTNEEGIKKLVVTSKEGAQIKIKANRPDFDLTEAMEQLIKVIPLLFKL